VTKLEWAELTAIVIAVPATWLATPALAWPLALGTAICYGAALLLGQGLVRDLIRLAQERGRKSEEAQRIKCLCAESTVGLVAIAGGSLLLIGGIEETVVLTQTSLTGGIAGILVAGFIMKNYAISIRKIEDHNSVIVG